MTMDNLRGAVALLIVVGGFAGWLSVSRATVPEAPAPSMAACPCVCALADEPARPAERASSERPAKEGVACVPVAGVGPR